MENILNFTIVTFFSFLSTLSFAQNKVDTLPFPLVNISKTSWEKLNREEKLLFYDVEKNLKESYFKFDSVLNVLQGYLINQNELTNDKVLIATGLIYQIPKRSALLFLLKNIDAWVDRNQEGRNRFPFYMTLEYNQNPNRLKEIIDLIFRSDVLNDCDINGRKLVIIRNLIGGYYKNLTNLRECLDSELQKSQNECRRANIEAMISQNYPNVKYATKIVR